MNRHEWKRWWEGTLLITRREVRDQLRDWRIVLPIVGLTLFFPLLMNATAKAMVNFVARYGADIVAERLFPFLMMVVGFFPASISLVVALESFAGERERRTMEPLLVAPLSDAQLYVGKLLAVLFLPLTVSYVGVGVYVLGLHLVTGWWPSAILLGMVLLLTTVQAVMMVSAAVVISTQATSVRAANLLASLVIVPVALLLQGESVMMFYQHYGVLWATAAAVLLVAVLTSRMGLAHFNRENLLGREMDILNIRWMWGVFWKAFRGEAASVRAWYGEVWQDVKSLGWLMVVAFALMGAAAALGVWLVADVPTHAVAAAPSSMEFRATLRSGTLGGLTVVGWRGSLFVWWHNIRAMLLAAVGAGFTFGVLGILIPLLPYGLIGGALALFARSGLFSPWTAFAVMVLPHGVVEIPATALFVAATLRLGASLASPASGESLGAFWLRAWARWWRVFLGVVVPLMAVAAVLEANLTPLIVSRYLLH